MDWISVKDRMPSVDDSGVSVPLACICNNHDIVIAVYDTRENMGEKPAFWNYANGENIKVKYFVELGVIPN